MPSFPPVQESKISKVSRVLTLLTTNLIKVSGLGIALDELFIKPSVQTSVIALAAFMMAGAQLSEQALLAALDRLMGAETKAETKASNEKHE